MEKAEICRAITEKLEPEPLYKPAFRVKGIAVDLDDQLSKLGFWIYGIHTSWQPVDFFTSESASARLLDAMPVYTELKRWPTGYGLTWRQGEINFKRCYEVGHADRKTAIVLAACAWKQIEVGEIE